MKLIKKLIQLIIVLLIVLPYFIQYANCKGLRRKGNGVHLSGKRHKLKQTNLRNNSKIERTTVDYDLPDQLHIESNKLLKDLSAKLEIMPNPQITNNSSCETSGELLAFLNSNGSVPSETYNDFSNERSSGIDFRALLGLPAKNSTQNMAFLQIVSKVGLSALLWGNPIVGAVGSAALSIAFNQANKNSSDNTGRNEALILKKNEDEIYADMYKRSALDQSSTSAHVNSLGLNIKDVDKIEMEWSEFQDMVSLSIISQRSLMMLAARLENLKIEKQFETLHDMFQIYQDEPVQSFLLKRCTSNFVDSRPRFAITSHH